MPSLRRLSSLLIVATAVTSCASAPPSSTTGSSSSSSSSTTGSDDSLSTAARARLDELASAWTSFTFSNGRCPGSLDEIATASAPTTDPWGRPLALMPPSAEAAGQIVSAGPDGELLSADDLAVSIRCDAP